LRPLAPDDEAQERQSGTVPVTETRTRRLALGPVGADVVQVRAGTAALALLAVLGLGILSYARLGAAPAREIDRIRARHRSLLSPIDGWPASLRQPVVEVGTWDALRRIATMVQSPILDDVSSGNPALLVLAEEAAYVFRPLSAPAVLEPAELRRVG
jgi:hypothetical protein